MKKVFLLCTQLLTAYFGFGSPQIIGDTIQCSGSPALYYVTNDPNIVQNDWEIWGSRSNLVFSAIADTIQAVLFFADKYEIILTSFDVHGASIVTTFNFELKNPPTLELVSDFAGIVCPDTFATLGASGANYYWLYRDEMLIDSGGPSFHVKGGDSISHSYFVLGTDGYCIGGTADAPQSVSFERGPSSVCTANYFPVLNDTLENDSLQSCGSLASLLWDVHAKQPFVSYAPQWSNGSTSFSSGTVSSGSYTCTLISNNGCVYHLDPIVVNTDPLVPPKVKQFGPTLSAKTKYSVNSYQWIKGLNIIPGATNSTYTPDKSGKYSVTVTSSACSATSRRVKVVIAGDRDIDEEVTPKEVISFQIFDLLGRNIQTKPEDLQMGIYVIRATFSDGSIETKKVEQLPGSRIDVQQLFSE